VNAPYYAEVSLTGNMTSEERVNGDESEEFIALVTASGLKLDTNPDNVTSPFEPTQNLTLDRQRELATDSQSNLVDAPGFVNSYGVDTEGTNENGQYKLNRLFSNFQQGAGYVAIATAGGFSTDYATVYVQEDGFLNENQPLTGFNLEPEPVEPSAVDITQVGTRQSLTGQTAEFGNQSDEFAQRVSRDGDTFDVIRVETFDDGGNLVNASVEVEVNDVDAFSGPNEPIDENFRGDFVAVEDGQEIATSEDQITLSTGNDGVARVILQTDQRSASLSTEKVATLTNDRGATDESNVLFVGVTTLDTASISGIVTDGEGNDPVGQAVVWTQQIEFRDTVQINNQSTLVSRQRILIRPDPAVAPNPDTLRNNDPDFNDERREYLDVVENGPFQVVLQEFNTSTGNFSTVEVQRADPSELQDNYDLAANFANLSLTEQASDETYDLYTTSRERGTQQAGTYTLDPVPAAEDVDVTRHQVQAIVTDTAFTNGTQVGQLGNPGTAEVNPGGTDDANIVIPGLTDFGESNLTVTGLSAPAEVEPDESFTVEATVENNANVDAVGEDVEFRFDFNNDSTLTPDEVVATQSVDVDAGATETVTFDLNASDLGVALGTYAHGVAVPSTESSRTAQITITENATNGGNGNVTAPVVDGTTTTDPDNDGLYEDVNGDGSFTIIDVSAFLDAYTGDDVMDNMEQFDFNDDGSITITDVAELLNELNEA
jgi:hypothetical protein